MNEATRTALLEFRRRDEATRRRLEAAGRLFDGYDTEMEQVHIANAEGLLYILEEVGWPGESIAGADGAEAAWVIAQHAISLPAFQLRCLEMLIESVDAGEVPASHGARLLDRIRFNQRRPQVYGTIFDWDEEGRMSPWWIEDPEEVDARRGEVGLPPLDQEVARVRDETRQAGESPPGDFETRQQEIRQWAVRCGWV